MATASHSPCCMVPLVETPWEFYSSSLTHEISRKLEETRRVRIIRPIMAWQVDKSTSLHERRVYGLLSLNVLHFHLFSLRTAPWKTNSRQDRGHFPVSESLFPSVPSATLCCRCWQLHWNLGKQSKREKAKGDMLEVFLDCLRKVASERLLARLISRNSTNNLWSVLTILTRSLRICILTYCL